MISNLVYIGLISVLLIISGWSFKAIIAMIQGKPINTNWSNPLNLKARWPTKKNEQSEMK